MSSDDYVTLYAVVFLLAVLAEIYKISEDNR